MINMTVKTAVALAEALRQSDPAAYASITNELGLTAQTPMQHLHEPQPRQAERDRPSLRVRAVEQPSLPREVYDYIERKGGKISLDEWRRRTRGKTADEAFDELDPLVQMGVAHWHETPSTGGRTRREIFLV